MLFQIHESYVWRVTVAEPPLSPTSGRVEGEVKLSISYRNSTLFIMVMHIRDLVGFKNEIYILKYCFDQFMSFHSFSISLSVVIQLIRLFPVRFLKMEQIPTRMWRLTCFQIHTRLPNARQRSQGKPGILPSMRWLGNTMISYIYYLVWHC